MIFVFEIIFRNYELNLLYKTNAKRKKKKENVLRLNILRNLSENDIRIIKVNMT